MSNKPITVKLRLGSMLLDHAFMCFIIIPPYILFLRLYELNSGITNTANNPIRTNEFIAAILFALYFCKDSFGGRSIAKRILKLQVVDNKTGGTATPIQCFIRNIFAIIWPVEVIISLFNTERRLGDILAGTKITRFVHTEKSENKNLSDFTRLYTFLYYRLFNNIYLELFLKGVEQFKSNFIMFLNIQLPLCVQRW
jgi:uncharacterized RDD family membrane protein YckC